MGHRFAVVAVLLVVAVFSSGCPKGAYHGAVVAEHAFTSGLGAFQKAEIAEYQNGRISVEEHHKIEAGIEKIGTSGIILVNAMQSGAANPTISADLQLLIDSTTALMNDGVLGVKNPNSQAILKASLQTAQAVLSNVQTELNTATPVAAKP